MGQYARELKERENKAQMAEKLRYAWIGTGVVVMIIVFIVIVKLVGGSVSSSTGPSDTPVADSVFKAVTTIPQATFDQVSSGATAALPQPINATAVTSDSKPEVVYIGAEFCPYCATERWPMVIALSRFGTFTGLKQSHSSTTDVYPNTQTFSFHGSTYTSQYLAFSGVETLTNIASGTSYTTLDTPTADEQNLINTYDAAPYVPATSAGSIPFIDFGGKYITSGASYDVSLLQGKTADEIATALSDPTSDIAQGVIGAANTLTASICSLTKDQPSSVCADPMITAIEGKINAQTAK